MKDGSFLAAWRFRGRDLASSTAGEVAALAEHVNTAIASYGDGWMVHVDAVRRRGVGADRERCHFPDPVSALVDETRRARYTATAEHYETDAVFTLTYTPPGALTKRMERAVVRGRGAMGLIGTGSWAGSSERREIWRDASPRRSVWSGRERRPPTPPPRVPDRAGPHRRRPRPRGVPRLRARRPVLRGRVRAARAASTSGSSPSRGTRTRRGPAWPTRSRGCRFPTGGPSGSYRSHPRRRRK